MKRVFLFLLKIYRNLQIKYKLLLILYVQIIVPLLFIGYASYKNSENIINNNSINYSQDILGMMELRLYDYVRNLNIMSQDLLYEKNIYNILGMADADSDLLQSYELESEVTNTLKKLVLSREEIQSICLVSNNGRFIYADNNSRDISIIDVLPYMEVLESARAYGAGLYGTWMPGAERCGTYF
jgi:two-component system sensor histidine kinase YesM